MTKRSVIYTRNGQGQQISPGLPAYNVLTTFSQPVGPESFPMQAVRPPAVAGSFFPADPVRRRAQVAELLAAPPQPRDEEPCPKVLIAPHAGYVYSGPTAATAYRLLLPHRQRITRVVLLGPAHRVRVAGLALPSVAAFATPLGQVPLDRGAASLLQDLPQVCISDDAHALEHSIEVHLPFLQHCLDDFSLVPLAVGGAAPAQVAEVLRRLWGGDETLVVISSDLSHYLPYADARRIDHGTTAAISALAGNLDHQQACGATPVNGLMLLARQLGLAPRLLDYRNSGDTAGDRNRVVGYAAFAFYPGQAPMPEATDGSTLLRLARAAIADRLGWHYAAGPDHPSLDQPGATFVTLHKAGRLRGCIGSLQAHRSLREDVRANAQAAAFNDPRFEPLRLEELREIDIEVSLLSPQEPMAFVDERDLLSQLRPGLDGLVLQHEGYRATFLPQVWDTLPEPAQFLCELKRKAGLAPDFWHPAIRFARYGVQKWAEPPRRP